MTKLDTVRRGLPRTAHTSGVSLAPVAMVCLAALIWSTSFAVTKILLPDVPPLTIGAARFSGAAVLLFLAVRTRKNAPHPAGRQIAGMAGAGFVGITAYFTLENFGVQLATASDATLIVASYPILTLLLEMMLGMGKATATSMLGMLLAVVGVWVVVWHGASASGNRRLVGDLILVCGGIAWACYNVIARRSSKGFSPVTTTCYQTCAGAMGFIALAPIEHAKWHVPTIRDFMLLLYLAVFCSVAAFLLYNAGLRQLSPTAAVNILNLVPIFGLIFAVIIANEAVTPVQIIGCLIVIVGVALGVSGTRDHGRPQPISEEYVNE